MSVTVEGFADLFRTVGPVGVVLLAAGLALRHLHAQLSEVQEKRIADAQATVSKILEIVDALHRERQVLQEAQHEDQEVLAKAIEANASATREMRLLLESLIADRNRLLVRR